MLALFHLLALLALNLHGAAAGFFVYKGETSGWPNITPNGFYYFSHEEVDCNMVLGLKRYAGRQDVSGANWGVACDGPGCRGDAPWDIDRVELNVQFGHYTIYKDRGWQLYNLEDKVVGHCKPKLGHRFTCLNDASRTPTYGQMWFWCESDVY